jgi:transcription termination factor Rho
MDRRVLEKKALAELREIADALDLGSVARMKKADLVDLIMGAAPDANGNGSGSSDANDVDGEAVAEDAGSGEASPDAGDAADADAGDDGGDGGDDDDRGRNRQRRRRNRGGQGDDLDDAEVREGVLDLLPEGYGFLRTTSYLSGALDVYVSQSYVRRFNLRRGDRVAGPIRSNNRGSDKFPALARVDTVEGIDLDDHLELERPDFRDLTAIAPTERLTLETDGESLTGRLLDLVAPIGKGQRGLIVAPPRTGKSMLLRDIATSIRTNHPDVHVMALLVDERPEEITAFERATDAEVIAASFDRPSDDQSQVAELAIERAKRLVERGQDVVVLLDSMTRLGRAYNLTATGAGRTLPGGIDAGSLYGPRRLLAAARNLEEGGSLTVVATALVDTGSLTDQVILEQFEGTANMEVRLDRGLAQQRMYPAVDVRRSSTRQEELLLGDDERDAITGFRRDIAGREPDEVLQALLDGLASSSSNKAWVGDR